MRLRTIPVCIVVVVLFGAACGADDGGVAGEEGTATSSSSTTEPMTTTSTTAVSSSDGGTVDRAASEPIDELEVLSDKRVVYHEDDEGEWTMDVFYPSEAGPWPLVVVYHGMTTGRSSTEARRIAESGAVAVAPQWLKATPPTTTFEDFIVGDLFDRAACAAYAAQHLAADYGADPMQTTIVGFSAGAPTAAWIGLGVVREDVCALPMLYRPVGTVLGDSQLFFYEDGWDPMFADASSPAADTTDRMINPERWDIDPDAAFYLWSSDFVYARDVADPPEADSWIWSRDTTGDLVDDLAAVSAFDNGRIGWKDNANLLERRLDEAGYSVTHELVGGGHAYSAAVYGAIDELIHREGTR